MKYFSVEQWDNDYNAFVQTYSIRAESLEEAREICYGLNWSGHTYIVKQQIPLVIAQYLPTLEMK